MESKKETIDIGALGMLDGVFCALEFSFVGRLFTEYLEKTDFSDRFFINQLKKIILTRPRLLSAYLVERYTEESFVKGFVSLCELMLADIKCIPLKPSFYFISSYFGFFNIPFIMGVTNAFSLVRKFDFKDVFEVLFCSFLDLLRRDLKKPGRSVIGSPKFNKLFFCSPSEFKLVDDGKMRAYIPLIDRYAIFLFEICEDREIKFLEDFSLCRDHEKVVKKV